MIELNELVSMIEITKQRETAQWIEWTEAKEMKGMIGIMRSLTISMSADNSSNTEGHMCKDNNMCSPGK